MPRVHRADGLYMVTTPTFSASFQIEAGKVIRCAPILRRRLDYWMTVAEWIGPSRSTAGN